VSRSVRRVVPSGSFIDSSNRFDQEHDATPLRDQDQNRGCAWVFHRTNTPNVWNRADGIELKVFNKGMDSF
jgi:hypothetical protein